MSQIPYYTREEPCPDCPFRDKDIHTLLTYCENGDVPAPGMLCHESRCLDGNEDDRLCVWFYRSFSRACE